MKFYTQSGRQIHYYNEGIKKIDMLFVECLENYSISTTYEKGKKTITMRIILHMDNVVLLQ